MHDLLTRIADDYPRLPEYLPTDTAPRMDTMGRNGTKIDPAVPIRCDVSDLIREVGLWAVQWEAALRETYLMGVPYWTKPRPRAVQDSLRWSAGIIESPPLVRDDYGFERPGILPDALALWIEESARTVADRCSRIVATVVFAPRRLVCPACDCPTLFYDAHSQRSRCIRCGTEAKAA